MTDIQQNNMAMYQDILMKLSQQQHVPGINGASMPPRTPPNAASLMAAAATGNHNLLQNNQNSMHLLQQLREAANRSRTYGSVGQQSDKNSEKNSERASPQSSTPSTSNSALALALVQDANKNQFKTQDPPKTPRRNDQKEQHKCPKCDYTTPWKSSIATHMKLKHSNERPWRCDICGKAYKLKHHLKAHMEGSHASEKPYQCKLCVFSCIDSRTLNKHMFNKHGRQTPIKTNQMMNGRSPSNLSSMIPSLIGQRGHPMGRGDPVGLGNPFLLNHNRNLINLKAQEQMQETLRNRFSALSAAAQATGQAPNFEQIQFLQEQMAAQLAAQAKNQNQENFPKAPNMEFSSESPFSNAPNTALLAQIAAQMQRIQAQNVQNSAQNTSTGQNSHNTTPEDESLEEQSALGGEAEGENESEKICEITEVNSDNGAKIEEIDASSDTKMEIDQTGTAEVIEDQTGNAGVTEMTIEPTSPDATPTGSPTAPPIKNESTPSNENELPNHRSGLPENSPIKVPSENSADENGSDTDKPNRKRKLDQPLDYNTMNEAILAQQRFGSSLRGPVPGLPFPYQLPFNHRRMSDGSSDDINSPSRLHPALNSHMASLAFQRMGGFPANNEMMNHLSQMQGIINSLPKTTQESNSPPTQISSTPTHEQASSQTITQPEFKCEHCQLTFPDENFLKCHSEMHNNENNQPFECSKCKRVCRDSLEFFLHFRNNEHDI